MIKLSDYKKLEKLCKKLDKKIIILANTLCDIRSDMTCKPPYKNKDWAVDKICLALAKVEAL